MKAIPRVLIWLASAALAVGCTTYPTDSRVVLADDVRNRLGVADVRCSRATGDYLTLQARVNNTWAHDLGIEWRVAWLDADGIEINPEAQVWRKLVIATKDSAGLKATAPQLTATDARFYVRKLRK